MVCCEGVFVFPWQCVVDWFAAEPAVVAFGFECCCAFAVGVVVESWHCSLLCDVACFSSSVAVAVGWDGWHGVLSSLFVVARSLWGGPPRAACGPGVACVAPVVFGVPRPRVGGPVLLGVAPVFTGGPACCCRSGYMGSSALR